MKQKIKIAKLTVYTTMAALQVPFMALADTKSVPVGPSFPTAQALLSSKSDSSAKGAVNFFQTPDGIRVSYWISGLDANKTYGFHIHEKGSCKDNAAKSAGGHYVKVAADGGTSMETPAKYAGDMPEITANDHGVAAGNFLLTSPLSIDKDNPIAGHAVILHNGADDVNKHSAPRIACGVIKQGKAENL